MKIKKKRFRCLICDWEGTNPTEIESIEPDYEGKFKVCPICSQDKNIPTGALIHNLTIELFEDDA